MTHSYMKAYAMQISNCAMGRVLLAVLIGLGATGFGYSQDKPVMELKGETAVKSVRGGEKLLYTFTVTNQSGVTAKDVTLIHRYHGALISTNVSQGEYDKNHRKYGVLQPTIWAHFGDIQGYASAILTVEIKIFEWGGEETYSDKVPSLLPEYIERITGRKNDETIPPGATRLEIDYPGFFCGECVKPEENSHRVISVIVLPSKNLPPRIKIITPTDDRKIARTVGRAGEVTLQITASDPDGSIEKVRVDDSEFFAPNDFFYEDGVRKIKIQGKVYTVEELEENPEPYKYYERLATKTGPGTYTYTLKNLRFGYHVVHVIAYDNGGRDTSDTVRFTMTGDAKIGFEGLVDNQVVHPAEFVKLTTVSTINDSKLSDLRINIAPFGEHFFDVSTMPQLRKISSAGNVYRHEYLWKAPAEGAYNLRLVLLDHGLPTNDERITVTRGRKTGDKDNLA